MTQTEQQRAAKKFSEYWAGKGKEKQECNKFWLDLLCHVFGINNFASYINFEGPIVISNTSFIDGYIPSTKVLIEQKGIKTNLDAKEKQSDGSMLTPYEQAKRYADNQGLDDKPRWIVVCNFKEFRIYDMKESHPENTVESVFLENLERDYHRLSFLVDKKNEHIQAEEEISKEAGVLVGKLYDALLAQYKDKENPHSLKSLNALCVRLVFCLYAEDSGLFGSKSAFRDYMEPYSADDFRDELIKLFKVLDTKIEERDPYLKQNLAAFPYVNGGLFADETIEIPCFTDEIIHVLLKDCSTHFDWCKISPTIFGAVFESTLNPETRRSGGMHYTSIENIHKVIDPLFLDDLNAEFEQIKEIKQRNPWIKKLIAFQEKLSKLTFLDPACGSGNFLTESYICLRRLENKVLLAKFEGNMFADKSFNPIIVNIHQFYGIEINDFAVSVAKAALWIAESQMIIETEKIIKYDIDFLPLKSYSNIIEGNALQIDWNSIGEKSSPDEKCTFNYIMGNPPFVGQAMRTKEQANDIQNIFAPLTIGGKLDYVAGWYKKAADLMENTKIQCAFVSTNSICQGESVNLLWKYLLERKIIINFAYQTFKWSSDSNDIAAVMCVIVGFSYEELKNKYLFANGTAQKVQHINGYLQNAPDVFIQNRSKGINIGMSTVVQGSPPADDGRLLITAEEKESFIKKYPELEMVIKPFVGSREFINDTEYSRYCFWFADTIPSDFQHIPELKERFNYIREYRLRSPVDRIQKTADKPYLFTQNRQPKTNYLIIPRVSSETRTYIPIGFLTPDVIASDAAVLVYNATLYDFGLLCSKVHNAWMRTIAGRLKSDYRYAPSVYYNFPFPTVTPENKARIEETANSILEARKKYSNHCLADMYGKEMYLYPDLMAAHKVNDKAVMQAYGFPPKITESECVAELFKLYEKLTEGK